MVRERYQDWVYTELNFAIYYNVEIRTVGF